MTIVAPPAGAEHGKVVGRFITASLDTTRDSDDLPDYAVARGTVTFRPAVARTIAASDSPPSSYVVPLPVVVSLDRNGILAAGGHDGVKLVTGVYAVSFDFEGVTVAPFQITVTAAHTDDNPLDLPLVAPEPISPTVKWVVNEQVYRDTLAAAKRAEEAADRAEEAGITGPPGPKGDPGEDGKDGADGLKGDPGADGKDGADGLNGKDGADGLKGDPGEDGKDGADGLNGKDGADGLKGDPGADGDAGVVFVNSEDELPETGESNKLYVIREN